MGKLELPPKAVSFPPTHISLHSKTWRSVSWGSEIQVLSLRLAGPKCTLYTSRDPRFNLSAQPSMG